MKVKNHFQKIKVTNEHVDEAQYEEETHDDNYILEEDIKTSNYKIEGNKMKKTIQKMKNKNIIRSDYEAEKDEIFDDYNFHHKEEDNPEDFFEEDQEYLEEDLCDDLYEEINNINNYNHVCLANKDLL